MQNKANLLDTQMNISSVTTKEYENKRLFRRPENKPKQSQFQYKKSSFKSKLLIFDHLALLLLSSYILRTYVNIPLNSRITKCPNLSQDFVSCGLYASPFCKTGKLLLSHHKLPILTKVFSKQHPILMLPIGLLYLF
jgi:hypothetical protein